MPRLPAFFGREDRAQQTSPLKGWEGRLYAIGRALDEEPEPLRDLAVSTTKDHAFVSGLARHSSLYQGGWASVTYRVEDAAGEQTASVPPRKNLALGPDGKTWATWLRVVGVLLDRGPGRVAEICLIEVAGGVVVGAMTSLTDGDERAQTLVHREFTVAELDAAMAEPFPDATVRPVILRALEGPA